MILRDLQPPTVLSRHTRESYLANLVNVVLAERYLERMIGRMIDINYHLVTESGHPPPKDYHESFQNDVFEYWSSTDRYATNLYISVAMPL